MQITTLPEDFMRRIIRHNDALFAYTGSFSAIRHKSSCKVGDCAVNWPIEYELDEYGNRKIPYKLISGWMTIVRDKVKE